MDILEIIRKKRDRRELNENEIRFFVSGVTDDTIPDYQISAMLMAVFINGMNERETFLLTQAMTDSGDIPDTSRIDGVTADKHSTGGVGDKTTLITAPIAASLGCRIAKMSGRGLGHTGGTADKLESIPGFKIEVSPESFFSQVNDIGICIAGQSGRLAPADKKIYALRDVTATTESLPLIASSIMSKKLALGADCIVLDVKYGRGAFMKTPGDAERLAGQMIKIGTSAGRKMSALITNMEAPLGTSVGNALEIIESVKILRGKACGESELALESLSVELAAELARLCFGGDLHGGGGDYWRERAYCALRDGSAYAVFRRLVEYQGGDVSYIDDTSKFGRAPFVRFVKSEKRGYLSSCDAEKIGEISVCLGAGRKTKTDSLDPLAGIVIHLSPGSFVNKGDILAELHTSNPDVLNDAERMYSDAVSFSDTPGAIHSLIHSRIS